MPDSAHPRLDAWLPVIEKVIGEPDNNTILVGHSIGGTTILRYLESLAEKQNVRGIVVVATPVQPLEAEELRQLDHFFGEPFDYMHIKQAAHKIVAIYSANDHRVPILNGHLVRYNLATHYIEIPEGGHLNAFSGYSEFPELLKEVKALLAN